MEIPSMLVDDDVELAITFDFLSHMITEQSIREDVVKHFQFFKVKDINIDSKNGVIHLKCETHEYLPN